MYDDIRGYCKTCNTYQRNKPPTNKSAGLATTLPTHIRSGLSNLSLSTLWDPQCISAF
jgi:hypothetical protein